MGHALFQGWTEHQLQAAFAQANKELAALRKRKNDYSFWQDAAYIAMLTGEQPA